MDTELRKLPSPEMNIPVKDDSPSSQQADEKHSHSGDEHNGLEDDDEDYITGFRLILILTAGTLVQFVMMLDQSIIATV